MSVKSRFFLSTCRSILKVWSIFFFKNYQTKCVGKNLSKNKMNEQ